MKGLRLLLVAAALVLVTAAAAPAHPNEFEVRMRVFHGLAPGQPGAAPALAPRAASKGV